MKQKIYFGLAMVFIALTASAFTRPNGVSLSPEINAYDVVVYGGTPSGIAAAVAAARENKSVVLIEPLPIVGGMMSGGLSFSDSNQMYRETLGGLFEEFHQRIEKLYQERGVKLGYKVAEKDTKVWTYEPHVAEKVFQAMLKEANVRILLKESLNFAEVKNSTIYMIQMHSGVKISGKVFIDASYEGDLMAAAKVTYRIGRESSAELGESLGGAAYPKKPVMVPSLDKHRKPLPLISGTIVTPEGEGDHRIMTYSFRFCFTEDSVNRVPFDRPKDYNPARYELFRRFYKEFPKNGIPFDLYPIPGNKLDGNNSISGQLSIGLVGENWDYPGAGPKRRKMIWNDHESYTKGLFYFLTTDSGVPEHVRNRMKRLGYARDEFVNNGHFPPVLYVREARRMVGTYFLTQTDVLEKTEKIDAIGVGSFPIDSHDCQRIATPDGGFINEGTIFPDKTRIARRGIPYQIPYGAIVPKKAECTNLLVPVCLSSSHVAFSSLRVEPTWIVLGESAGIAAALALEANVAVQDINVEKLKARLASRHQILTFTKK
ncbi:FAD dependent oxidoreductase [Pedobacter sp. ok626]|uniref:FAD-dependent oxidoreductase n=1 Tax=Pedobacter sp. ok626 TaxID=1761882 RepID=UPI0008856F27|nr:FAD-dependent oxidoreductase [Pedobacter sp. ok626]SDK18604.1 FAD dependent oxidoreductase [Pedobacter sp. ok626]